MQRSTQRRKCTCIMCMCSMRRAILRLFAYICLLSSIKTKEKGILQKLELSHPDADSVTFHGDIFGGVESLTCGIRKWIPHVSDSTSPRMSPWNVTESQSISPYVFFMMLMVAGISIFLDSGSGSSELGHMFVTEVDDCV